MNRRDAIASVMLLAPVGAGAQSASFPSREIQLVVPYEPGGNMGNLARLLADALAGALPQPVIVTFKSGADGNIGTSFVARSEPDGRTLLLTGSAILVGSLLHPDAGYQPLRDFEPIARIAVAPNVLLAHESLRGVPLATLLRSPVSGPGSIAFATAGHGQTSHIAGELFKAASGASWLHVPYRGTGPAVRAVLSGEVQVMFVPAGAVAAAVATGRAFAMAVAAPARLASLPETPTLAELGVRGADYSQWYGVFAPAATPPSVCAQLSELVVRVFSEPGMKQRLAATGEDPATLERPAFAAFVASEYQRVSELVKRQGIKAN